MERIFFTNNSRKMAGIPLRRKKDKRKRLYTRNRADEDITAFIDYCDGKWEKLDENGKSDKRPYSRVFTQS